MCGWSGAAGLPLIAMMPSDVTAANSHADRPERPDRNLHAAQGQRRPTEPREAILDGDNAVIVMPRDPLADGAYTATVNTDGGSVTWSFNVNRNAPLSAQPTTPPPPPIDATPATDAAKLRAGDAVPVTSTAGSACVPCGSPRGAVTPIQITDDPEHPRRQRQLREHRLGRRRLPDDVQLHDQRARGQHARLPARHASSPTRRSCR